MVLVINRFESRGEVEELVTELDTTYIELSRQQFESPWKIINLQDRISLPQGPGSSPAPATPERKSTGMSAFFLLKYM
jgi:hypothetical protein